MGKGKGCGSSKVEAPTTSSPVSPYLLRSHTPHRQRKQQHPTNHACVRASDETYRRLEHGPCTFYTYNCLLSHVGQTMLILRTDVCTRARTYAHTSARPKETDQAPR